MRKLAGICLALLVFCSCSVVCADDVWDTSIQQGDVRIIQQEGCASGGACFSIQLFAPGKISSIEFKCRGKGDACSHVHPCPDADKCGAHKNEFELSGASASASAMFWAWSDANNAKVTYDFKIHYQYP